MVGAAVVCFPRSCSALFMLEDIVGAGAGLYVTGVGLYTGTGAGAGLYVTGAGLYTGLGAGLYTGLGAGLTDTLVVGFTAVVVEGTKVAVEETKVVEAISQPTSKAAQPLLPATQFGCYAQSPSQIRRLYSLDASSSIA